MTFPNLLSSDFSYQDQYIEMRKLFCNDDDLKEDEFRVNYYKVKLTRIETSKLIKFFIRLLLHQNKKSNKYQKSFQRNCKT